MFTIFDEELMKDSYYRKAVDSLPDEQRCILEEKYENIQEKLSRAN